MDITTITTTLNLALITTLFLLIIGIPIAFWLSESKSKRVSIVETIISLPLVLPPSVLGFYLLLLFGPKQFLGRALQNYFNITLIFNFTGMVVASIIFGLPFMIHPLKSAISSLSPNLKEASYTLGKSKVETLIWVLLPNIKPSIMAAVILTFCHALGEFGVILMIGGNIPGETKVISIAIYDEVQAMNYSVANSYSLLLLSTSFLALLAINVKAKKGGDVL